MKSTRERSGKSLRIGDVVEIMTPSGLAYLQYSHVGGAFGELVRVLPGLYEARPKDIDELTQAKEMYFVFYTLDSAVRLGDAKVIANRPIPNEWTISYPMMRQSAATDGDGRTVQWRLISAASKLTLQDLQNSFLITQLSPEQRKLSLFETWPHPVLVKELARGWTPERSDELRFMDAAAGREIAEEWRCGSSKGEMQHFLYFANEKDALVAGEWLRSHGFSVEVRDCEDGDQWLVLACKRVPETAEQMNEERYKIERFVSHIGGEYDGWGAPFKPHENDTKIQKTN
jgi:hypothetical protein